MTCTLTYLGHSGFHISDDHVSVAVDPFLTGNPSAKIGPAEVTCSHIALTHGHEDHVGDTLEIAKSNDAVVIASFELATYFSGQGIERTEPGNHGGRIDIGHGSWIAFTQAIHSSSYEGQYMGMPAGLILHVGDRTIYHCGDTDIFSDMKLIGEMYKPDPALIPIGDRFTMGPELASRAADLIGAPRVVPIHYNTWPPIEVDVTKFRPASASVDIMAAGDSLEL